MPVKCMTGCRYSAGFIKNASRYSRGQPLSWCVHLAQLGCGDERNVLCIIHAVGPGTWMMAAAAARLPLDQECERREREREAQNVTETKSAARDRKRSPGNEEDLVPAAL